MEPPYSIEDCNWFSYIPTPEQSALPWGPWVWDEDDREFTRECEVPEGFSKFCIGLPFAPNLFFFEGRLVIGQTAKRVSRRSGKATIPTPATREVINRLGYTPAEWACFYCHESGTSELGPDGRVWHADHKYPVCLGGDNLPDNMALSCATCNLSKGPRSASEYIIPRRAAIGD